MTAGTCERRAIRRQGEILAECPLGGICNGRIEDSKEWLRCGHYGGMVLDRRGLRVVCGFLRENS